MAGSVIQNPFSKTTQVQQPQSINDPANVIADPNKSLNDPNNKVDPNADPNKKLPGEGDDPMLDFKGLWEDDVIDPKNPPEVEPTTFLPTIDPVKLQENFNKIDFSKYATPEETAAIVAGGEGAAKAHSSVLNKSMRQAMLTMFTASSKMVEAGLTTAQERFLKKVPSHVKDILVEGNLTKSSKLMSNPAFAPLIESTRQRYQEKFPKATADQISSATERYMQEFVKAASAKDDTEEPDNAAQLQKGAPTADWEKWIETDLKRAL